jgi:triacylglycerol esterase/lipase EstA (alpha/beta hydrolase family)
MKQLMASTRGTYDLHDGHIIKDKPIFITPKDKFNKLAKAKEVVIFVHGMRNSTVGAKMGTNALRLRLRRLGYKHPVIGFSYDSNVRGAHKPENYHKVLLTAKIIAVHNGKKLFKLIKDIKTINPNIKIKLVGHSLGCDVILWSLLKNKVAESFDTVECVYLFGSPIEIEMLYLVNGVDRIINYFNPNDSVIKEGVDKGELKEPTCLHRIRNFRGLESKRIYAKDHRFKSQMKALRSFL